MTDISKPKSKNKPCRICGQIKAGMVPGALIRPAIMEEIRKSLPEFNVEDNLCIDDLNQFRFQYVQG